MVNNATLGDLLIGIVSGIISGGIVSLSLKLIEEKKDKKIRKINYGNEVIRYIEILISALELYKTSNDSSFINIEIERQPFSKGKIELTPEQEGYLQLYMDAKNSLERDLKSNNLNVSKHINDLGVAKHKIIHMINMKE